MTDKPLIPDAALDRLWRTARSFDDYTAEPVTDAELRALYDLAKWGPTTANSQPQRVVFVRSAEAKQRLAPALSSQNKKKVLGAPVVAILAYDMRFFEHLPKLFHNPAARSWYETTPEAIRTTALRNATLRALTSCWRPAPSGSTAARCRVSRTTWWMRNFSRTAASSRISCAVSATAIRRPCRNRIIVSASMRSARSFRAWRNTS